MSRLNSIDAALVRMLGNDFSIIGTRMEPVAKNLMNWICSLASENGSPATAVLKAQRDSLLASDSAIVLSVNLFSLIMVRLLSSEQPLDASKIEFLEFLLRFFEAKGSTSETSHTAALAAKSHTFVRNQCRICTRCTFS